MKKLLMAVIAVVVISALAACGAKPTPTDTLSKVQADKKIMFGLDDAFPPMGFRDENNKLVGFDIDMAAELGKRMGVEFVAQPTAWDGVVASLTSKKFDAIISGMTITPDREKQIAFSKPYLKAGQVIIVKADNNVVKDVASLKGKIVATQSGSSAQPLLEKMTGLKDKKYYSAFPEAFNDLAIGRIDALIADATTAPHYMTKRKGVYKVTGSVSEEYFGIGMRKEDTTLKAEIDKTLAAMQADGTMKKISDKWFGFDATTF